MKALVNFAMVFEVEEESDIAPIVLAMRQMMWLKMAEKIAEHGYDTAEMQMYAPTYSFELDFDTEVKT